MSDNEHQAVAGLPLLPWQARLVEQVMAKDPDGTWTHPKLRLAVPRYYPDPDLCVMRPDRPHVCLRPDHDARHGRPTPKETT